MLKRSCLKLVGTVLVSILSFVLIPMLVLAQDGVATDYCGRPLFDKTGSPIDYSDSTGCTELINTMASGRFEEAVLAIPIPGDPRSATVFHQNGEVYVAISNDYPIGQEKVWVYKKDQGNLTFTNVYSFLTTERSPRSITSADLENDGLYEIIVANFGDPPMNNGNIQIMVGNNTVPLWSSGVVVDAGKNPYGVTAWNDSIRGFSATNWNDTFLSYARVYGPIQMNGYTAPRSGFNDIVSGDLDGNGISDILASWGQYNLPSQAVTLYYRDTTGYITGTQNLSRIGFDGFNFPSTVEVGNIDYDPEPEIIVSSTANVPYGSIIIWDRKVDGTYQVKSILPTYNVMETLDLEDIDCDGDKDIVGTAAGWRAIVSHLNDGDGNFGNYYVDPHNFYFSHAMPGNNASGMFDFNRDGRKDYYVVSYNHGLVIANQKYCVDQSYTKIKITKSAPSEITRGELITYTMRITNTNSFSVTGHALDVLPSGTSVVSSSTMAGVNPLIENDRISWYGVVIEPNQSVTGTFALSYTTALTKIVNSNYSYDFGLITNGSSVITTIKDRKYYFPLIFKAN